MTATLLHDVGHLVNPEERASLRAGRDALHEDTGAAYLAQWFGPPVVEPVRLHVDAKRYLCAVDPTYLSGLSLASVRSLVLQGGPFAPADAERFIARPFAPDAIRLRRWDDLGKDPHAQPMGLADFRPVLRACLVAHPAG